MNSFASDSATRDNQTQGPAPTEIPVMDAVRASELAALLGPESFQEIARLFVDQATDALDEVLKALSSQAFDEIVKVAHSMKGSASTFGCDLLADLYRSIEYAAKNQDSDTLAKLTALLQDATQQSLSAVSQRL